jgi:hypothetical protein
MKTAMVCALAFVIARPLAAQDEVSLKKAFEGHYVVAHIDMPATSKGIDVYPTRELPLEFDKYSSRLREAGVAIHEGQRVMVTKVHVKNDLIEFQLAGGGFSLWDSSGSVSASVPKTSREKDLERQLKGEHDPERRRRLQRELDEERDRREREQRHEQRRADEENAERRQADQARALDMGSRFNVRYDKHVPPEALTPRGLMRALSKYVEFPGSELRAPRRAEDLRYEGKEGAEELRKGMSLREAKDMLGEPEHVTVRRNGDLDATVAVFRRGPSLIEATFVSGVLVKWRTLER